MLRPFLKPRNSGFSLLEALLAVGITTLFAGTIYGIVFTGIKMAQRIRQAHQEAQQIRIIMDTLTDDLENMTAFKMENDFIGTENYLELTLAKGGTLKRIRYRMASDKTDCATLWRDEKGLLDAAENYQTEIIADDIQANSFRWAYAYKSDQQTGDALTWQSSWQQKDLPAGIHWEFSSCSATAAARDVFRRDIFIPTGSWGRVNVATN